MTFLRTQKKWLFFLAFLAASAGVLTYVYLVPPTEGNFYLRCHFNALTGLHCPGCGSTRCVHALVHGDFAQAVAFNAVATVVVPAVAAWICFGWFEVLRGRPFPTRIVSSRLYRWFLIFFVLFGIVRNLPLYPCTLLAPHVIEQKQSEPCDS